MRQRRLKQLSAMVEEMIDEDLQKIVNEMTSEELLRPIGEITSLGNGKHSIQWSIEP